jgi:hypothetical protein
MKVVSRVTPPLPVQVVDGLNLRLVNQFGSEHLGNRDIELETFSE